MKSRLVLEILSFESSASSIVLSRTSRLTLVVETSPLLTVAISLVLRSSEALTAVSRASCPKLVTVLSPLLLTSTPPSFIESAVSRAS